MKYLENNVIALMLKANKLTFDAQALLAKGKEKEVENLFGKFAAIQRELNSLGCDAIPEEEYNNWVSSMKKRKE